MHTYFINTSGQVSCEPYKDILLKSLLAKKMLIIPEKKASLENINEYTMEIARKIDEEADIAEETTFLIFFDINQEKTDSMETMRSYAAADELLLSMKAESGLVWNLCEMGKQPKKLIFVYAESVKRGRKIRDELMNRRIWYDFGLPDWEKTKKYVEQIINGGEPERDALAEGIRQYLTENAVNGRIIDKAADVCWTLVIQSFSNHAAAAGHNVTLWNEEQWYSNFRSALNNYISIKLRDVMENKYAFSIEHWYQTWEDRDTKEKNRSECRLMLFLYAVVHDEMQLPEEEPLLTREQLRTVQTPAEAFPVPNADYEVLGEVLADHYHHCSTGVYTEAEAPKRIHEELAKRESDERDFIKSIYNPKDLELIPKELESETFAPGCKINLKDIISILGQPEGSRAKAVHSKEKGLAAQIRRTIRLIRKHCEENTQKIEEYITRITNEYNRIKDEQLEKMPFTAGDCPDFTQSDSDQRIRMNDDLENIEKNVDRLIAEAERDLLQPVSEIPKPVNMDREIRRAEEQTAYYLSCLKKKMVHLIFWIIFILAVLVPYIITTIQIFQSLPGYLFLGATAVAAAAALAVGYIHFYNQYHGKIQKVMNQLVLDFISSQKENKQCIKRFRDLLYKRIPRCYGLHHYRRMLLEYKEDSRLRRLKITYHETARERLKREIIKLVDNLDLRKDILEKRPGAHVLRIDPDKDCTGNEEVYILSSDEVRKSLVRGAVQ